MNSEKEGKWVSETASSERPQDQILNISSAKRPGPGGAPEYEHLLPAKRKLLENLWLAQKAFNDEPDGGVEGCKLACKAIVRFIGVRHENPELAIPFMQICSAFEDIQRGVDPDLFSRSKEPRPRSRSSQRKHAQLIAASCMEVLMRKGESKDFAARKVARSVVDWPFMKSEKLTEITIINWRDQIRNQSDRRNSQFNLICDHILKQSAPVGFVEQILKDGPIGSPRIPTSK